MRGTKSFSGVNVSETLCRNNQMQKAYREISLKKEVRLWTLVPVVTCAA